MLSTAAICEWKFFKKMPCPCQWKKYCFLSLRVFGLLSSSLLLFPQRFRNNNKDEDNSPKTL